LESAEQASGERKMANRTSHRYNRLPLLPSDPGGVQQELVVLVCRCKDTINDSIYYNDAKITAKKRGSEDPLSISVSISTSLISDR
jgi:hypothetical protein